MAYCITNMVDAMKKTVFLKNLGKISYAKAFSFQKELVRAHLDVLKSSKQIKSKNTLIICEHYPVYTVGIQNKKDAKFYLNEKQRLIRLGADFEFSNRGGLTTFHGPGQLVCYPILNLAYFTKNMKWYIAQLENTLINTCRSFGLNASTTEDTGVWIGNSKIAAIGVHAKRWITSHGVALNCNTDLRWFKHIVPCGIVSKGVTSLSQETNTDIGIQQAIEPFLESFEAMFNCHLVQEDHEEIGLKQDEAIEKKNC